MHQYPGVWQVFLGSKWRLCKNIAYFQGEDREKTIELFQSMISIYPKNIRKTMFLHILKTPFKSPLKSPAVSKQKLGFNGQKKFPTYSYQRVLY